MTFKFFCIIKDTTNIHNTNNNLNKICLFYYMCFLFLRSILILLSITVVVLLLFILSSFCSSILFLSYLYHRSPFITCTAKLFSELTSYLIAADCCNTLSVWPVAPWQHWNLRSFCRGLCCLMGTRLIESWTPLIILNKDFLIKI